MKMSTKKKYLIALTAVNALIILVSLAGAGDTFDNVFQGVGRVVGGLAIGLVAYPVVWLFRRKSEYKFEIALVIGSVINLIVALGNIA